MSLSTKLFSLTTHLLPIHRPKDPRPTESTTPPPRSARRLRGFFIGLLILPIAVSLPVYAQSERVTGTPCGPDDQGFIVETLVSSQWVATECRITSFPPSANLCPVAELDSIGISLTLNPSLVPGTYADWDAVISSNPTIEDFLVTPGDYRSWGILKIYGQDGLPGRKRTIRYHDAADPTPAHPVVRADTGGNEAIVD